MKPSTKKYILHNLDYKLRVQSSKIMKKCFQFSQESFKKILINMHL